MPPLLPSLALLLLVLLTLLAISNRELIALTFLGMTTLALPLSVWIMGAIALGFLLGIWILLLFRFGTAAGAGAAPNGDRPRNANLRYGAEDFAVVGDGYSRSTPQREDQQSERESAYAADYEVSSYAAPNYSDNRFDDIYDRGGNYDRDGNYGGDSRAVSANSSYGEPSYQPPNQYDAGSGYGEQDYGEYQGGEQDYDNRQYDEREQGREPLDYSNSPAPSSSEPRDRFSAASGGYGAAPDPSASDRLDADKAQEPNTPSDSTSLDERPADWDDEYREDWTEEELTPEPVLRNNDSSPRLKRWFSKQATPSQDDSSRPDNVKREPYRSTDPIPQDRDRSNVYDADYRVIQPPAPESEAASKPETAPPPSSMPQPETSASRNEQASYSPRQESSKPQNEWDIESDLDW